MLSSGGTVFPLRCLSAESSLKLQLFLAALEQRCARRAPIWNGPRGLRLYSCDIFHFTVRHHADGA